MLVLTLVLASGLAAAAAPDAKPAAAPILNPVCERRMFNRPSADVWTVVQSELQQLGLKPDKVDKRHRIWLTEWVDMRERRPPWLPAPEMPSRFELHRARFQVFVSPYAEPARLYVGSVLDLSNKSNQSMRAVVYNAPELNQALLERLVPALGQGHSIPTDFMERRKLALATLGEQADTCALRRTWDCASTPMKSPRVLGISELEITHPMDGGPVRTVVVEVGISEDGGVVSVNQPCDQPGSPLDTRVAGPLSLRVYEPTIGDGCPVASILRQTVRFR